MAKIQRKPDNANCWWGCRATGTLRHCWWESKIIQSLWKMVWQFLTKLNIVLNHMIQQLNSSVFTQLIWTFFAHTNTCRWMNVHSKFSPDRPKQPRCLSVGECINCYIHTVEYYSVIKKWAIHPFKDTIDLKYISLSERSQSEKIIYSVWFQLYRNHYNWLYGNWHYGKGKTVVKRWVVFRGLRGEKGWDWQSRGSFRAVKVFYRIL